MTEVAGTRRLRASAVRELDDAALVARFQADQDRGAVNELLRRHEGLVMSVAHRYYVPGGDQEDVRQQAMIGFWKAARDYVDDGRAAFTSFARTCMQRQVITAVKAANRMKHTPLTDSDRIPVGEPSPDDTETPARQFHSAGHETATVDRIVMDSCGGMPFGLSEVEALIEAHGHDRVHALLESHYDGRSTRRRRDEPDRLSENEAHVLVGLLSGKRYREIAADLGRSDKFVDNTVQRLRNKLRHLLDA